MFLNFLVVDEVCAQILFVAVGQHGHHDGVATAAIAQVAYNNAMLISDTMKKLDKIATYLTIVSIFLGVVATAAAILQLVH